MGPLLPWLLAIVACAAALASALAWRAEHRRQRALALQEHELRARLEHSEKRLAARNAKQHERAEETSELRRKLEKAKKRTVSLAEENDGVRRRVRELEERLLQREVELKALRAEIEPLRQAMEREHLVAMEQQRDDQAVARERTRLEKQSAALEEKTRELNAQLVEAQRALSQYRKRLETQEQLYTAIRGELRAKKDRLRTQQEELERLRALRVVHGAQSEAAEPIANPSPLQTATGTGENQRA